MAPKVTSSRNRSTRQRSKNPTSSQNRPQRSRASTNSQRITQGNSVSRYSPLQGRGALSVTQSPWSNSMGTGAAKVTTGAGRAGLSLGSLLPLAGAVLAPLMLGGDSPRNRRGTVGYNLERQQRARESENKYNTMDPDGTIRSRLRVGPAIVGPAKAPQRQELSAGAKSFDRAFAAAREEGLSTFTWRGKQYTTELA